MVWGIDGSATVLPELLEPLGLISYGGSSKDGEMTYRIYSETNDFEIELKHSEIKSITKIYNKYLRENKLNRIVNGTID